MCSAGHICSALRFHRESQQDMWCALRSTAWTIFIPNHKEISQEACYCAALRGEAACYRETADKTPTEEFIEVRAEVEITVIYFQLILILANRTNVGEDRRGWWCQTNRNQYKETSPFRASPKKNTNTAPTNDPSVSGQRLFMCVESVKGLSYRSFSIILFSNGVTAAQAAESRENDRVKS